MVKAMEQIRCGLVTIDEGKLGPRPYLEAVMDEEVQVLPSRQIFSEYEFAKEGIGHRRKTVKRGLAQLVMVDLDRELAAEGDKRIFVRHIEAKAISDENDQARYAIAALLGMIPKVGEHQLVLASDLYVSAGYMNAAWTWLKEQRYAQYTLGSGFETFPLVPAEL